MCEDLLSSVDQPLKIARDKQVGKDYLLCDYNRDGDSYRWNTTITESVNDVVHQYLDLRGATSMTLHWKTEQCPVRD